MRPLTTDRLFINLCSVFCILYSPSAFAWDYTFHEQNTTNSMQIRVGAEVSKKWNNGLRLHFEEDLRSDVYNSSFGASFKTSHTTLSLSYLPIEYVRFDVGYTLKINGPQSDWTAEKKADPNEWIRHRAFASVTGIYQTQYIKLSLRERFLMEARTDSVNLDEKSKYAWQLRSKLGLDIYPPGKPLKPYIWCELINTLNAPEFQQKNGRQFITSVRAQAGLKWRVSRLSSLDFYYRFTYGYNRDINVNKKYYTDGDLKLTLTEETLFQHAIGVIYCLDW